MAGEGRARRPGTWRGSLWGCSQWPPIPGGVLLRWDNATKRMASSCRRGSLTLGSRAKPSTSPGKGVMSSAGGPAQPLVPALAVARHLGRPCCITRGLAAQRARIVTRSTVPAGTPTSGHGACPWPAPRLRERESSWSGEKCLSSPFGSWRKGLFLHSGFCRSGFSAASRAAVAVPSGWRQRAPEKN